MIILEEALKLLDQGYEVTIASNHQTDGDGAAKRRGYEQYGHIEFANKLVYPAGLKMRERPYTNLLMGADHAVYVATPFDIKGVNRVLNSAAGSDLTEDQLQTLTDYRTNLSALSKQSTRKMKELISQGHILSVYPESTRSRNGYLQEAPREVSIYFRNRKGLILPVVTNGLGEVFPPDKVFDIGKALQGVTVEITIGKAFLASKAWDIGRQHFGARDNNPAEVVMAQLAELNPALVQPSKRSYYQSLVA